MSDPFPIKRRFPRYKLPPVFKIKARIRMMGAKETHYFRVDNLSMGGASLVSAEGVPLTLTRGDTLEILLTGGPVSLKCVARFIQATTSESRVTQMGIEIIGIDEKSRKTLGDFLEKIQKEMPLTNVAPRKTTA